MLKYHRFTRHDWYGWAGASKFADGTEPFYFETTVHIQEVPSLDVEDVPVQIIACGSELTPGATAVEMAVVTDDGDYYGAYRREFPAALAAEDVARWLASHIGTTIDHDDLLFLGFAYDG